MAETGSSGDTAKGHGIRDFDSGKGAAATEILKVWRERGRVRGGEYGHKMVGVRKGMSL